MSTTVRIGHIVSSGYPLPPDAVPLDVETPWGDVRVHFSGANRERVFIHRHGDAGAPPHRVNHRANIDALARSGVTRILATHSAGALRDDVPVPSYLVPDDLVDFTHHADATFDDAQARHIDVTEAYCAQGRRALLDATVGAPWPVASAGTYCMTRGPRLETPAEVRALARDGHVVGMTGGPEATLARERGICYASLCVVVNAAAGLGGRLDAEKLVAAFSQAGAATARILDAATANWQASDACQVCGEFIRPTP